MKHLILKAVLAGVLTLWASTSLALDKCDSGSWYDPASNGQGLSVEISETIYWDKPNVVVYYYTYDGQGVPFWFVGTGNQTSRSDPGVVLDFSAFVGLTPPDYTNTDDLIELEAGTAVFTVHGDTATFNWQPVKDLQDGFGMKHRIIHMEHLFKICD